MMGLARRGVKRAPRRLPTVVSRPGWTESDGRRAGPGRAGSRPRGLEQAGLHQQDKGSRAQPTEQRELDRRRRPERADEEQVQDDPEDRRYARLGQAQQDLVDEIAHQTARRPWSARMSVTSSAYSRSPPTGSPRAIRLTTPTTGSSRSARYIAVASPSSVGLVAMITSTRGLPSRAAESARSSSSRIRRRSGPMPSIGEMAPCSTW